jgi:hypothetical protein
MKTLPAALITAFLVQPACQLFKVIYYSIVDRRLRLNYLITPGGMPSSHSAFVTSLTVAVGMNSGFFSDIFAVSAVFAAIVIYDAWRLRGTVQEQSKVINRLTKKFELKSKTKLPEMVGHDPCEILAGVVVGAAAAVGIQLTVIPLLN